MAATITQSSSGRRLAAHGAQLALVTLVGASALFLSGWIGEATPFSGSGVTGSQTHVSKAAMPSTGAPTPSASTSATLAPSTHVSPVPANLVISSAPPRPAATVAPTSVPAAQTPRPQTVFTINVPVIKQTMVLDCETAALQMGLATYGYYYSQAALFARENPDLRAPVMGPNHNVLEWGDPYSNFVGDVNGNDWTPTGYGVYYPVILQIARNIGLTNAHGGEGYSAATVYQALKTGHAVEVWIETNWTRPGVSTWTAWDGRTIRYSYAEHAVTLSGISPNEIRVNDPLHGNQYWISKATFETSWADFDNMAVIF